MMKCNIIKDLFPNYIDGLTSEESNQMIEEHLGECAECRKYLDAMMTELTSKRYKELNQDQAKAEIRPFKKLGRRMFYAVLITAVVVGLLCGVYESYFYSGYSTLPGDVEVTYENVDGVVVVGLIPKKNNVYILGSHGSSQNSKEGLTFTPVNWHTGSSKTPKYERGCYLRYIFREDETVICEDPFAGLIELQGDETLTIKFGVKSVEMTVSDFRTEAGAEKLRQWLKTESR